MDLGNKLCLLICIGVGSIKPVYIGQKHQKVCLCTCGYNCSQCIVVPHPDLFGCYGVVLVYDRDYTQLQKPVQCIGEVLVPLLVLDILGSDQNLPDSMPVL